MRSGRTEVQKLETSFVLVLDRVLSTVRTVVVGVVVSVEEPSWHHDT